MKNKKNNLILDSKDLEEHCLFLICEYFEGKKESLENLKKFVKSIYEIRKQLQKDFMSYNMLHELNFYLNDECKPKWFKISTNTRTVSFNLEDKKICIVNIDLEKQVDIEVVEKISEELQDFIIEFFHNDNRMLDLKKLETEKFSIENDLDFSGF